MNMGIALNTKERLKPFVSMKKLIPNSSAQVKGLAVLVRLESSDV